MRRSWRLTTACFTGPTSRQYPPQSPLQPTRASGGRPTRCGLWGAGWVQLCILVGCWEMRYGRDLLQSMFA